MFGSEKKAISSTEEDKYNIDQMLKTMHRIDRGMEIIMNHIVNMSENNAEVRKFAVQCVLGQSNISMCDDATTSKTTEGLIEKAKTIEQYILNG
jgi:hypothetical protein